MPKRGVAFTEPQGLEESEEESLFADETCNGVKLTVPATNFVNSGAVEFQTMCVEQEFYIHQPHCLTWRR